MLKLIKNIYMYPTSVQWFVWLKFENACILLCLLNIIVLTLGIQATIVCQKRYQGQGQVIAFRSFCEM